MKFTYDVTNDRVKSYIYLSMHSKVISNFVTVIIRSFCIEIY